MVKAKRATTKVIEPAQPGVERLLTIPELAARLRVSERTGWRLVHEGRIRSIKVGRARRVREAALESFLRAHG